MIIGAGSWMNTFSSTHRKQTDKQRTGYRARPYSPKAYPSDYSSKALSPRGFIVFPNSTTNWRKAIKYLSPWGRGWAGLLQTTTSRKEKEGVKGTIRS